MGDMKNYSWLGSFERTPETARTYYGRLVILNTSILTAYGKYDYRPISLESVKLLLSEATADGKEILSAVGHEATANVFSELTGYKIEMNRIQYAQKYRDVCIVLKLKGRPQEGKVLTVEEMEKMGYEFGMLTLTH